MNTNRGFYLLIGAVVALLTGCSPKFYLPNTQNVPMIQARGHSNITVAGNGNQVEFQGAYGITDGLAVQVNGGWFIPKDEDNGDGGSGRLIEGGLGYFKNISENWLFDTYALAGVGRMENHFPSLLPANPATTGKISANIARYSLQPSLSFHRKYFSVTGSARLSSLNYSNIEGSLFFENLDQVAYLRDTKSSVLIEPALTLRGGIEKIKLQIQLMRSFNLTHSDFRQDKQLLSVGLNFNFR